MKNINYIISSILIATTLFVNAQVAINTDGSAPDASAMLEVKSTEKGMLIPRMSTDQRSSISSPAKGLLVFDNNTSSFWFYNGSSWSELTAGGSNSWTASGNNISNTNSGDVGIGTSSPNAKLDVRGSTTDDGIVLSVGNSNESHKISLFGGKESDPNPFIFRKAGDPLRFVSDENGWTEHMRIEGDGRVGIGTDAPASSAKLEVNSTANGFLPPRMTEDQMNAISNPGFGLMVMCTDCNPKGPYYFDGSNWLNFATASQSGMSFSDVVNPTTGETWMDRNLGATQVATSSTDADAYGDLYQWGRGADGHEKRNSGTTSTLSNSNTPGHGNFILAPNSPIDWRSPQNDGLWQGVNGVNNPCPSGYRLPTEAEWEAERQSWASNNAAGAIGSPLKLPVAGYRGYSSGSLIGVGSYGLYWSSTVNVSYSRSLDFHSSNTNLSSNPRAFGFSIRCIKD